MNAMRMQAVANVATSAASPTVATGDFLAALMGAMSSLPVADDTMPTVEAAGDLAGAPIVDPSGAAAAAQPALAPCTDPAATEAQPTESADALGTAEAAVLAASTTTASALELSADGQGAVAADLPAALPDDAGARRAPSGRASGTMVARPAPDCEPSMPVGRPALPADQVDAVPTDLAARDDVATRAAAGRAADESSDARRAHATDTLVAAASSASNSASTDTGAAQHAAAQQMATAPTATRRPVSVRTSTRPPTDRFDATAIAARHVALGRYAGAGSPVVAMAHARTERASGDAVATGASAVLAAVGSATAGAPAIATAADPAAGPVVTAAVATAVPVTGAAAAVAGRATDTDPKTLEPDAAAASAIAPQAVTAGLDDAQPVRRARVAERATEPATSATGVADRGTHPVPAAPLPTVTGPARIAAPAAPGAPAHLGMMGTDRVDRVRQQVGARPVQRLTVDLDDTRIAVRVRGDRVSVDVLRDPDAALGQGWATDVERTLQSAMRAQDLSAARTPDRERPVAAGASPDRSGTHSQRDGSNGGHGDGRSDARDRHATPWWTTEEDE